MDKPGIAERNGMLKLGDCTVVNHLCDPRSCSTAGAMTVTEPVGLHVVRDTQERNIGAPVVHGVAIDVMPLHVASATVWLAAYAARFARIEDVRSASPSYLWLSNGAIRVPAMR